MVAAYVALWVGYTLYTARYPDPLPGLGAVLVLAVTSVALGMLVGRWWAPLVVIAYLPTLAFPAAYGAGDPDYGVGLYFAILVVPAVALLIALGVLLSRAG